MKRLSNRSLQKAPAGPASANPAPVDNGRTMVLRAYTCGMFANVHFVAEFARTISAEGRDFVVKWKNSAYMDPNRVGDPWLYYFEPVFDGAVLGTKPGPARKLYPGLQLSTDHMFHPRLIKGVRDTLALPANRAAAQDVLQRFIRLNSTTQAFIDDFADTFFTRPVIGLHLRGPGRVHGGALELRLMLQPDGGVPYEHYFAAVDAALVRNPDALVFGCSDSLQVIARIRDRYGDRALFYPSSRSDFGEMHEDHPENAGQVFSPYKLGLDVIVEAHLLARSVHFVHGNSNVANYVLARAPDLANTYVYGHLEDRLVRETRAKMSIEGEMPD